MSRWGKSGAKPVIRPPMPVMSHAVFDRVAARHPPRRVFAPVFSTAAATPMTPPTSRSLPDSTILRCYYHY
jgi:hypothetical protein